MRVRKLRAIALLGTVCVLGGCAGQVTIPTVATPQPPAAAPATAGPDRNPGLDATLWVQTSAEHGAVLAQAYELAALRVPAALTTPGSALLEQPDGGEGLEPAVIFDVDETVLDNAPDQARGILDGTGYSSAAWDAWVAQRSAAALPGAASFVARLRADGIVPLFVTNRACGGPRATPADPCPQEADTLANLRAAGFGDITADQLWLKGEPVPPEFRAALGIATFPDDKGPRRQVLAGRYRIVMQFGDQLTDFISVPPAATPAERVALAERQQDLFATRWVVLPNAMYGAWLNAIPAPRAAALRPPADRPGS